eukprot:1302634-Amphidinium_carterae.1
MECTQSGVPEQQERSSHVEDVMPFHALTSLWFGTKISVNETARQQFYLVKRFKVSNAQKTKGSVGCVWGNPIY